MRAFLILHTMNDDLGHQSGEWIWIEAENTQDAIAKITEGSEHTNFGRNGAYIIRLADDLNSVYVNEDGQSKAADITARGKAQYGKKDD